MKENYQIYTQKNFLFFSENYTNHGRNYTPKTRPKNYSGIIKVIQELYNYRIKKGQLRPIYELDKVYQNYKSAETGKPNFATINLLYWYKTLTEK